MKCYYRWGMLAIVVCMGFSMLIVGCGKSDKNVVAKVNQRSISREEYISRLELTQVPGPQAGQQMDAGAYVLQRMIDEELILELAEKQGVKPTDEQIAERIAESKKDNKDLTKTLQEKGISDEQFKQMMAVQQAVFNLRTKGVKLEDKDVKKFYDEHKDAFTIPEQVSVQAIITKNKADAEKAIDLLSKGIQFSTVANQLSASPQLVQAQPMTMQKGQQNLPPILAKGEAAIFKTAAGKWTEPIALGQAGLYAVYMVSDHQAAKVMDYNEVKYKIKEQLMLQKGEERKNDVTGDLEKFRKDSKININIERYKKQLLQDQQPPVQP